MNTSDRQSRKTWPVILLAVSVLLLVAPILAAARYELGLWLFGLGIVGVLISAIAFAKQPQRPSRNPFAPAPYIALLTFLLVAFFVFSLAMVGVH